MKQRLLASLLIALLLVGCAPRPETPSQSMDASPPQESHQEVLPHSEEKPSVTVDGMENALLMDGDENTSVDFPNGGIIKIALTGTESFDRIRLQGLTEKSSVVIAGESGELYRQDLSGSDRWCYIGRQTGGELAITLPEGSCLAEISLSEAPEGYSGRLSAYLPISSFTENMLTDGSISGLDELTVNTACYWLADGSLEIHSGLADLLSQLHQQLPDLELYCTINPKRGGAAAINTEQQRKILIDNILDFCTEQQLSGVDIDWEFPSENQWEAFSNFIAELSQALKSVDLKLSMAFYPDDVHLSSEAIKAVSKVNVMAYDQFDEEGRHSTYSCAQKSVDYFRKMGFEPGQLSLGIPAYGRPLSGEAQWPLYSEYAADLSSGTNQIGDFYFNSPQLAQDKTAFAAAEQLYGVFLYHLGCDVSGKNESSLLKAVEQALS